MNPTIGTVVLATYGLLLAVGGLMGYLKAKSKPSLIAGEIGGGLALLAAFGPLGVAGTWLGLALGAVFGVFFGIRFAKSRKFMPGGLLAILSAVVLAVMVATLAGGR
jgi:uncharacterized membrane protein (UPF0136 family)